MLAKLKDLGMREKLFLGAATFFIFLAIVDFAVVQQVAREFSKMDSEIGLESKGLIYNLGVMRLGDSVSNRYEEVKGLLGESVSADETINNMKGELDDLARRAGLRVDSMRHREPKKTEFYDEYIVDIAKFETNMKNLLVFLHAIYADEGMLRVSRLTVEKNKGELQIKGSMQISKIMLPSPVVPVSEEDQ